MARGRTFVGGVVVGLAINAISDAYPGAAPPAMGAAVFLVALAAVELRRLPAGAPIQRLVSRTCLGGAAVAAIVSFLAPAPWGPWSVLASAALALTACLAPVSDRPNLGAAAQLHAVASIGFGVGLIGWAVDGLLGGSPLILWVAIIAGLALGGYGLACLMGRERLGEAWGLAVGATLACLGVYELVVRRELLRGVAFIYIGGAQIAIAAYELRGSRRAVCMALIVSGMAAISIGVVDGLLDSRLLLGAAATGFGVAQIGLGAAALQGSGPLGSRPLEAVAVCACGLGYIGLGVEVLESESLLGGVALIGCGLSGIGFAVNTLRKKPSLVLWFRSLITAPVRPIGTNETTDAGAPPSERPDMAGQGSADQESPPAR